MSSALADSPASVAPLAGSLGVRIEGVDIATDCSDALVETLRVILDEHLVIHLPGQRALTPEQQLTFAALWGDLAFHPYVPSIEGHPGIMQISDPTELTTVWHQDATHMERPPSVSILVAREIPSVGGDTQWANQYAAYEALSPGLRDTIDDMYAVHEGTYRAGDAGLGHDAVTSVHPVVVTHDRTGRRALFVNANYTTRFDGWTAEESAGLLAHLYRAAVRPELTCRHSWTVGDMVIWDNRATLHAAIGDAAAGEPRVLHRVTIGGSVPR